MIRLLADCGNSSIKLGLAHDGGLWLHERVAPEPAALDAFLEGHRETVGELVLLPGGRALAKMVEDWWRRAGGGRTLRIIGGDLPLPEVGQYPGCGIDRIVAGIAACAQERCDLIVIDAGTATTFGAWRWSKAQGIPHGAQFLGGMILPGARACISALSAQAPALPEVEPLAAGVSAVQRDTPGALAAAIGIGYPAMVSACLARLRDETGCEHVIVTGGAAQPLLGSVAPRLAYRPALVLEGMELLASLQP